MKGLVKTPLAISSSESYSHLNNNSDLVNMYVHMEESGAKSNHILLNTSGLELLATADADILGIYEFLGVVYIATKTNLYSLANSTLTDLGEVVLSDKVVFADNGIEMIFVSSNGYFYNPATNTLGSMEQEGWYPASTVAYMDGYFIFNRISSGQFFISQLFSHVIDPIDWATGEAAPDDTVGVIVASRQLWIIGEKTSEVWYDSGDALFPFTRISGAVTDIGCMSSNTISNIRSSVFFVGQDFKVYMTEGYQPLPISTSSIERRLAKAEPRSLKAFTYTENSHWFYCLTMDDNLTLVYDVDTQQWHRRRSTDIGRWAIEGAFNLLNVGQPYGFNGRKLYKMSIDYLTEDNEPIKREVVSLPLNQTVNKFRLHEVQLDMEVAFSDINALVSLVTSQDGGRTWSNTNEAYTGKVGEYLTKVSWDRLGQMRNAILKIIITDPIPIRILGLHTRTS